MALKAHTQAWHTRAAGAIWQGTGQGTLPVPIEERHGLNLGTARPALRRAGWQGTVPCLRAYNMRRAAPGPHEGARVPRNGRGGGLCS